MTVYGLKNNLLNFREENAWGASVVFSLYNSYL